MEINMIKNKKQMGFSLIELILVLGLSSLAFMSLVQYEMKKGETVKAEAGGEQFLEVGKALSSYIAREQNALVSTIATGTTAVIPLNRLQGINSDGSVYTDGTNCAPVTGVAPICGHPYLPATFNATNVFGTNYDILVRNTNGVLDGLVSSASPICEKGLSLACPAAGNPVKYDWIGSAMNKMGSSSGMITSASATTLSGYNAGWSWTNADFATINTSGKLGFRVGLTDSSLFDAQYLRLDGTSVMRGNMNMGNWDILNATNITYNGWIQGFGVLANTINAGTINNTGDIQTRGLYASQTIEAGTAANLAAPSSVAIGVGQIKSDNAILANNTITAMTAISTRDIFLGNADANVGNVAGQVGNRAGRVVPNLWLSDLLPQYSSRGIIGVSNGTWVPKPVCGPAGTPRVEVIPQITYNEGRVEGYIQPQANNSITWDLKSSNPIAVYANSFAGWWQIIFSTPNYGISSFGMTGIAHMYCDYSF